MLCFAANLSFVSVTMLSHRQLRCLHKKPRMNDNSYRPRPPSPYLPQAILQCAAVFAVLSIVWPYYTLRQQPLPWLAASLLIGALAFLLANLTRQYWWWRFIHALFAPAAVLLSQLDIAPSWYLLAFAVMFFIYRGALSSQVPLYLSSRETAHALLDVFAAIPPAKFIDLGAGIGSIACPLAKALNDTQVFAVENSFIPWTIGRLRATRLHNCRWSLGSLWQASLGDYDVAYAFLSPVPMADLWSKAKNEMRSGTLFISNSFPVPGIEASFVIDVKDSRRTRLYCYRV